MKRLPIYIINHISADTLVALTVMGMRGTSLVVKFIFTLFIARYMSFETLGAYGLIASASIIASLFFGLTLIHTISRNAVTQTQLEICRSIRYYGQYILFVYMLLLIPAYIIGALYDNILLSLLILIVILFEHINGDFYRLFLNLSKPFLANLLHFVRTAIWMIVFMLVAYLNPDLKTLNDILIAWILGGIVAMIGTVTVMIRWPWREVSCDLTIFQWVKNEFKQARNMHITSVLTAISQYWSHFLISILLGLQLTGVFVFFMQIMSALSNLVQTGVIQIAKPKLVRAFKNQDQNYMKIFFKSFKDTMIVSVLMALCAWPSLYFVTLNLDKPLALEWFSIFPYILILFVLTIVSEVLKLIFYSYYRDDIVLKISIIAIISSVILNTILVFFMSLWGAVFAQIIVYVIVITYIIIQIRHLLNTTEPMRA